MLKKLKLELPYNQAIPLLGIFPKETKTLTQKRYLNPYGQSSIIYNSQDMETTYSKYLLTDKWTNKLWYSYTVEDYSAIKNEEICHLQ